LKAGIIGFRRRVKSNNVKKVAAVAQRVYRLYCIPVGVKAVSCGVNGFVVTIPLAYFVGIAGSCSL